MHVNIFADSKKWKTDDTGTHRYDPIRVFEYIQWPIPIRVLLVLVTQPLISLYQAGRLEMPLFYAMGGTLHPRLNM